MAKIIGLSGPQGAGKSTLLEGLRTRGITVDDYKVSRAVQAELGWHSLERATHDLETMILFQNKILQAKYLREEENRHRNDVDVILVERTFADIISYVQLWASKLVQTQKCSFKDGYTFTRNFADNCADKQSIYSGVAYLPSMPNVKWQHDPHRAKQEDVDFLSTMLLNFLNLKQSSEIPTLHIIEETVEGRVNQMHDWIKTI